MKKKRRENKREDIYFEHYFVLPIVVYVCKYKKLYIPI